MGDATGISRRDVLAGLAVTAGTVSPALAGVFKESESTDKMIDREFAISSPGWEAYQTAASEARARWLHSPWSETPDERARAMFQVLTMQHVGFNSYISPLHSHPVWSKNMPEQPLAYQWGLCNPDFLYQFTYLDGARTYRIWGKRGTPRWTEFHVHAGFWGDDPSYLIGIMDFDDLIYEPDDSFEVIASPEPHEGNWIKLDPKARNVQLFLRNVAYDWTNDQPVELHIEALDRTDEDKMWVDLDDIEVRLHKVAKFMQRSTDYWLKRNDDILSSVGYNRSWQVPDETDAAGNTACKYVEMLYNLKPDEALIIETPLPEKAAYWGVQLADLCWQTLDFTYHQSCLNGHQTVVDSDGKARFVLSLEDPGVANWLDAVGVPRGAVTWRWVEADVTPVPTATKVPLVEVRKHLSEKTNFVSPEERRASLAQRRQDVWRLYGV